MGAGAFRLGPRDELKEPLRQVCAVRGEAEVVVVVAKRGLHLLKLSVDQKCFEGEYYLGLCHEQGYGVPKDRAAARRLYASAAKKGVPKAAERLAQLPPPSEEEQDDELPPPAEFKDAEREALCAEAEAALREQLRSVGLGHGA